jgi:hypothetical protein
VLDRSVGFLIALILIGHPASRTAAQPWSEPVANACFEVILPQARVYLRSIMLLNRCSGESWLLVRTQENDQRLHAGRSIYRWRSIAIDKLEPAVQRLRWSKIQGPDNLNVEGKCFGFDGRLFCE